MTPSGLVSWKALIAAHQTLKTGGVPDSAFSEEVLEAVSRVSAAPAFVKWDLYLDLIEQAHAWCGSDERLIAVCENFDRSVPEVVAFASPGLNLREFCRFVLEVYDVASYPDIAISVKELDEEVSELSVTLPPSYRDGTSWFIASVGALRTMTRHLNLPPIQVDAEIETHSARYRLRFPATQVPKDTVSEQTRHRAVVALFEVLRNDVRIAVSRREPANEDARLDQLAEAWKLTPRQRSVLACICRGLANKEISSALELSVRTVEIHVTAILQKAGLSSRSQLVSAYAKS